MKILTVPSETEWQTFLDADSKLEIDQVRKIRRGLLSGLKPPVEFMSTAKITASEIQSFWSAVAAAIESYAEQLVLEAGEDPPDEDTLTNLDQILEAVTENLGASNGENHHIFLARVCAVTGLFKLFEAEQGMFESHEKVTIGKVIDAAVLEREASHMRVMAHKIKYEYEMAAKIEATNSKNKKGGDNKNAVNKAIQAEFLKSYYEQKQDFVGKFTKTACAIATLKTLPHIKSDLVMVLRWVKAHEKPEKIIEHL